MTNPIDTYAVPSVSIATARTDASARANELGMRAMQERADAKCGEQYLPIKSPPASGKSRALMFIALNKLHNQGLQQAIYPSAAAAYLNPSQPLPRRSDMTKTIESLAAEVLQLPRAERSRLLNCQIASLDADAARDAAWDAVAEQRDAEIEAGTVRVAPLDDVLKRLRAEHQ